MVWWQLLYQSWYPTHKNSLLNDLHNDVMCGGKVLLRGEKKTPTKTKQNFCSIVSGNMLYMFVHLGRLRSDEASNEVVNQIRKLSQTFKGTSCKPETTSYTELKRENSKGLSGMKQMTLSTSSLLSHSEKEVLVRSRAQQKNRNLSNEVKKVWIKPQLSWKLDLLIASLFHCQNHHPTEQQYLSNIATGQTFPHW